MEFVHSIKNVIINFLYSIDNAVAWFPHAIKNAGADPVVDMVNACIFLLAFCVTYTLFQFKIEKRRDRVGFARELYRDYLNVALENPDLSIAEYDESDPKSSDKYDTFVSIMLASFDELLNISKAERRY